MNKITALSELPKYDQNAKGYVALEVMDMATAHIIAAAPAMYDALVQIVEAFDEADEYNPMDIDAARQVLAKADGDV